LQPWRDALKSVIIFDKTEVKQAKETKMEINLIYITAKDHDEAEKIGQELVKERLAAGVNIFDKVKSLYWWEGKIRQEGEALIIAQTKESLVSLLIERVKSLHSYVCPCVVALPVKTGNKEFIDWVINETK
jgi:periplasmic divalent cation tolerance protein